MDKSLRLLFDAGVLGDMDDGGKGDLGGETSFRFDGDPADRFCVSPFIFKSSATARNEFNSSCAIFTSP